jgi:hypothetical protein
VSELYEPWQKLIRIVVLGRVLEVPENNVLLRQLQYVAPDIGWGRYCWNAECRICEVEYTREDGRPQTALACRLKGVEGMRITGAAPEVRYNLAEALTAAPRDSE